MCQFFTLEKLNRFILISSVISTLISVGGIVEISYALYKQSEYKEKAIQLGIQQELSNIIIWPTISIFVAIIVTLIQGISAIFWSFKKLNLCLNVFIFFSILLIIPIISIVVYQSSFRRGEDEDYYSDQCIIKQSEFTMIQSMYEQAEQNLCKSSCECYYYRDIQKFVEGEVKVYSRIDSSKAVKAQ